MNQPTSKSEDVVTKTLRWARVSQGNIAKAGGDPNVVHDAALFPPALCVMLARNNLFIVYAVDAKVVE